MRLIARSLIAGFLVSAATPIMAADRGFPVGGFDRISSSVPFDVRVRTGGVPAVHATGTREMLDRLRIEVRGGELEIGMQKGSWSFGWSGRGQRGAIEVSVPTIQAATLSGPGSLAIDRVGVPQFTATLSGPGDLTIGNVEARQLTLRLSGPGNIVVAGRTGTTDMTLSGPGDIRAAKLATRDATMTLSGPGAITATVTGTARGSLSGPGDITIQGGARCEITKHGPGDVRCG